MQTVKEIVEISKTTKRWNSWDFISKCQGKVGLDPHYICDEGDLPEDNKLNIFLWGDLNLEEFYEKLMSNYIPQHYILILPRNLSVGEIRSALRDSYMTPRLWILGDCKVSTDIFNTKAKFSLTLPIYNEVETIGEVIQSFLPIADEIVVGVDEKTDDGSRAAIDQFLGHMDYRFDFKWEKSFSKARNRCINRCSKDWIFMTEGHEWLDPDSLFYFDYIDKLPSEVSQVQVKRQLLDMENTSVWPWLIRNHRGVHYVNDSHNMVISDSEEGNNVVEFQAIATIHNRSDEKAKFRRGQRNLMNKINLTRDLLKDKKNTRALFYLGNEYLDYNKPEKALRYYQRYLALSKWKDERYQVLFNCARACLAMNKKGEAKKYLLECFLEEIPRNEHLVMLGDLCCEDDPHKSIYYWRMASQVPLRLSPMWIKEAYYKEVPWQKLCIMYGRIGDLSAALECAMHVKRNWPDVPQTDSIIDQIKEKINEAQS